MCSCTELNSLTSSDYVAVITSLIAVGGVVIGALFAFVSQIILNGIEQKRELKRMTYEKQMDIYPKALQYVMLFSEIQNRIRARDRSDELKRLKEQENNEFNNFYYIFLLITPDSKIKLFDQLIDDITKKEMSPETARKKLQKILTFKKHMD